MTWPMKILLLGKKNSHLTVQHKEGVVKKQFVTQKPRWFLPCHSCCQLQLHLAVETVKNSKSLSSHFCKNIYSTILPSQMHTFPVNAMGFTQDQSWRVTASTRKQNNWRSWTQHLSSLSVMLLLTMCFCPDKWTIRAIQPLKKKTNKLTHLRPVPSTQELSLKVLHFCLAPAQLWWQTG